MLCVPDKKRDMSSSVMQSLDLRGNQLTGDMSAVGSMPYLARLSLAGNQLTGTIPAQMASNILQVPCSASHADCASDEACLILIICDNVQRSCIAALLRYSITPCIAPLLRYCSLALDWWVRSHQCHQDTLTAYKEQHLACYLLLQSPLH